MTRPAPIEMLAASWLSLASVGEAPIKTNGDPDGDDESPESARLRVDW